MKCVSGSEARKTLHDPVSQQQGLKSFIHTHMLVKYSSCENTMKKVEENSTASVKIMPLIFCNKGEVLKYLQLVFLKIFPKI